MAMLPMNDKERARFYRERADELRALAGGFQYREVMRELHRLAGGWEAMADRLDPRAQVAELSASDDGGVRRSAG